MVYKSIYNSPLREILLLFDEKFLMGLFFKGQKEFEDLIKNKEIKIFNETKSFRTGKKFEKTKEKEKNKNFPENKNLGATKKWLDLYFSGEEPKFTPQIKLEGTEFRKDVWKILLDIPYGETMTYKEIGERLVASGKYERMSAQAVGVAVGHNPISIIVPCHRVIGVKGDLIGYAGGLDKKRKLLDLEGGHKIY